MGKIYLKVLFMVFAFTISSCSLDDDRVNFTYTTLPITGAILPDTFELGDVYTINVDMLRPTDCNLFDRFDVTRSFTDTSQVRTVSAVGIILENETCEEMNEEISNTFKFEVLYTEPYIFKFFKGEDGEGEPEFIEIEVPVKE